MFRMQGLLFCLIYSIVTVQAELDLFTRFSRQLGGGDGDLSTNLINVLQKWANSVDSDTSLIKTELLGLKTSTVQIAEELQKLKGENINLKNEVTQANERTMNLKDNYLKGKEEIEKLRSTTEELKSNIREHKDVITIQIEELRKSNKIVSELKSKLSRTDTKLDQINTDYQNEKGDTAGAVQSIAKELRTANSDLATLNTKFTQFQSSADSSISAININLDNIRLNHNKNFESLSVNTTGRMADLEDKVSQTQTALQTTYKEIKDKTEMGINNLQTKTLQYVTRFGNQLDQLQTNIKDTATELGRVKSAGETTAGKLVKLSMELPESFATLSNDVNSTFTQALSQLDANFRKEQDQLTGEYGSIRLSLIQLESEQDKLENQQVILQDKQVRLAEDFSAVKRHQERRVESEVSLKAQLNQYEDKLVEMGTSSNEISTRMDALQTKLQAYKDKQTEDMQTQQNTMKGLERLGDSFATLKGVIGDDVSAHIGNLTKRIDSLELGEMDKDSDSIPSDIVKRLEERISVISNGIKTVAGEIQSERRKYQTLDRDSAVFKSDTENQLNGLTTALTNTRNAMAGVLTKISSLESQGKIAPANESITAVAQQMNTLKTNVIGLGKYINTVNRELSNLSGKTKTSVELLSGKIDILGEAVDTIKTEVNNNGGVSRVGQGDSESSSALTLQVTGLTSKVYTLQSNLGKLGSQLDSIGSGLNQNLLNFKLVVEDEIKNVNDEINDIVDKINSVEDLSKSAKTDISNLRAGITGLTSNLFNADGGDSEKILQVEEKMLNLMENVTLVSDLASTTLSEVNKLRPELSILGSDMSNIRNGVARLSRAITSVTNPARFSCGVTGEEVKVSGVIVYDDCSVNIEDMMNKENGHATAPATGDYVLTFTANMVSSDSQAIWCALYKQTPGDEGWKVLGMINNYQQDAGEVDDRDSGSITILATLEKGDQVWVEWRGYGKSFLYSNPYKLISFSGYMITGEL